jgi:RecJ-like exonuclease
MKIFFLDNIEKNKILYFIKKISKEGIVICPKCKGKVTVTIEGIKYQCSHCTGLGTVWNENIWWRTYSFIPDALYVHNDTNKVQYAKQWSDITVNQEHCFKFKKEAEAKCKELNKKL